MSSFEGGWGVELFRESFPSYIALQIRKVVSKAVPVWLDLA